MARKQPTTKVIRKHYYSALTLSYPFKLFGFPSASKGLVVLLARTLTGRLHNVGCVRQGTLAITHACGVHTHERSRKTGRGSGELMDGWIFAGR